MREKILNFINSEFEIKNELFIPGLTPIPVTAKSIDKDDILNIIDSVLDLHFTSGRFTQKFERKLADFMGHKQPALFVNSGSSANLLALSSLMQKEMMNEFGLGEIKEGTEVITVASSFPTTINPIFQNKLIPHFIDIDPITLNPDIEDIKNAINKNTSGIMIAHPLGNPYRADLISDLCKENNMFLVEDCCDSLGAKINNGSEWKSVGTFGEYSTLSFYPAHHITTGEGGAVFSNNSKYRRIAESVRDWGRHCWCDTGKDNTCNKRFDWEFESLPKGYDHKYIYSSIGYNLKATDMQAALGLTQLEKAEKFIELRNSNWEYLNKSIKENKILNNNFNTMEATLNTKPSWFGFGLNCKNNLERRKVVNYLESKKIATRLLFGGNLTKQPAFKNMHFKQSSTLENTDNIMRNFFWIGVHPKLKKEHLDFIIKALEESTKQS